MSWEELRANWINGNCEDVADKLNQMSRYKIFKLIKEAVEEHYQSLNGTHNGGIIDLLEILSRMTNARKN